MADELGDHVGNLMSSHKLQNVLAHRGTCPLPSMYLPLEEWRKYFSRLYGRGAVNAFPTLHDAETPPNIEVDVPAEVDVLNLTMLSSISPRAAGLVQNLVTSFPRHRGWGACFGNSCDSTHFMPHINVHAPVELAWRLRLYKSKTRQDRRRGRRRLQHEPRFAAAARGTWMEVTHCGGTTREQNAAYFYLARGSGLWINTGRSIAFGTHDEAVRMLLHRNCSDAQRNEGMWQCDRELDDMASAAAARGFDTVQFLQHCDAKCEQCMHEVAVLGASGATACPDLKARGGYRCGARAQRPCACTEHSHSVGTRARPFRGGCATAG